MRIIVTGGSGFLGTHLVARLRELGHAVRGVSRRTGCDVTDLESVRDDFELARPEAVYHLAGPSFVPDSKTAPYTTFETHVLGTINVLEAARRLDPVPRVLLTTTADAYLPDPARLPFDEETPQDPENPYAAAKIAQEAVGRAWFRTWGFPVVTVRLFNLIGPGQDPRFVASSFARQAAAVRLGRSAPRIEVGDLRVARDFIDWRDGIEGMRLALEKGRPGEVYNIASGRPRRLGELLEICVREARIQPEIVSPEHLARPGQALVRYGSPGKLKRETGWRGAVRPFEETLTAILAWWAAELDAGR